MILPEHFVCMSNKNEYWIFIKQLHFIITCNWCSWLTNLSSTLFSTTDAPRTSSRPSSRPPSLTCSAFSTRSSSAASCAPSPSSGTFSSGRHCLSDFSLFEERFVAIMISCFLRKLLLIRVVLLRSTTKESCENQLQTKLTVGSSRKSESLVRSLSSLSKTPSRVHAHIWVCDFSQVASRWAVLVNALTRACISPPFLSSKSLYKNTQLYCPRLGFAQPVQYRFVQYRLR